MEMNVNEIREHWLSILEVLEEKEGISNFLFKDKLAFYQWKGKLDEKGEKILQNFKNLDLFWGYSKICILDKNFPYVLKIPFRDEERSIEREINIFKEAQEENLDSFFGENICLGEYNKGFWKRNYFIYAMEKVIIDPIKIRESSNRKKSLIREKEDNWIYSFDEDEVTGCMEEYYSEEEMRRLYHFCDEMSINDIHSDNIGFLEDRPIIIDYAGV